MKNSSKDEKDNIKKKSFKKKKDLKNNNEKFFYKLKNWWPFSRVSGKIIMAYLIAIITGGFLLSIPGIVKDPENHWDFITGMFTASSAISDTGITMIQTNTGYSFMGQLLIIIMCQIGGIGILTIKITLLVMIGRKVSLDDQNIAQTERGNNSLSNTVEMIKDAFIFLLSLELIGSIVLFFGFYFTPISLSGTVELDPNSVTSPYNDFGKSLWAAIFHSISATNNAGFDIISGNSLVPYNQGNSHAYLIQITFLLQWVIGGLGYPTYHDIKKKIKARREGKKVKFSLFTKLNFITYITLFILGPILVFLTEYLTVENSQILLNGYYLDKEVLSEKSGEIIKTKVWVSDGWKPTHVWMMDLIFNVSSTRNAGFATVDVNSFTAGSKYLLSIWMFIGAAPSSTAGGIRTTTFAICVLAIFSIMRNKKSVEAFKRKIPDETVKRAFAVVFISFFIVITSIFVVYLDSNKMLYGTDTTEHTEATIIKLIMYVCSAFGTVGFQPFPNEQIIQLGVLSKIMLVITMFIGQLGISNTLLAFVKQKNKQNYGFLEEEVTIG
ncbi:TrkH family potassium uptake protein [Spiroplasma diminutum]|uniref:Potassium uptake protein KtrB n=1 Tax=Spiroplasma diminutum CUAS-1 TaxID=1276221 RepID=S5MIS1_9MOLU|nr:potassium transporter TrkG [Spiroplasma diminutum]AGR41825.1 potassium uptake protein KtrB [Spiroplasma diminutum CUAS-1]